MLNPSEIDHIYRYAYIPEHLPHYTENIAYAEAHLLGEFVCYTRAHHLIFLAYPLAPVDENPYDVYESACTRFQPSTVTLIAPDLPADLDPDRNADEDMYYKLDLPYSEVPQDVNYMVRRAARELEVHQGSFQREHRRLIKEFLKGHNVTPNHKELFTRVPRYLAHARNASLLEARKGSRLAAFSVIDLSAAQCAFYLFNFRSSREHVPGASDLLLHEMIKLSERAGKTYLNLGLGLHTGVRRFKEKWGGIPFLPYRSVTIDRHPTSWGSLAEKLC